MNKDFQSLGRLFRLPERPVVLVLDDPLALEKKLAARLAAKLDNVLLLPCQQEAADDLMADLIITDESRFVKPRGKGIWSPY